MRLLHVLLSYVAFALAFAFLLFHPKVRHGVWARLGAHPRGWPGLRAGLPRVWVHGASAGDVLALLPTVRVLRGLRPGLQVVATTITSSGRSMLERHVDAIDAHTYLPYDLPGAVRRTLDAIHPDMIVLEYAELGMEAVWRIEVQDFPAFILVDDKGHDFFFDTCGICVAEK